MSTTSMPIGNFDQPILAVADPESFQAIRLAIETAFAKANVGTFLKSLQRKNLRIRGLEDILAKGLLGKPIQDRYSRLGDADQGQIREFYLASLEKVAPELRNKFFKLYAYY